jgi:predicted PurR-regulated permease PerM
MADLPSPASPSIPRWTTRQVVVATIFVVAVILAFYLLVQLRIVLFIVFVAAVLGTAIRPGVDWLYQHNVPRSLGVILIYLVLVGLLVGFVLLVAPLIAEQVAQISIDLPGYYSDLRQMLLDSNSRIIQQIGREFPPFLLLFSPGEPSGEEALDRVASTFALAGSAFRSLLATVAVFLLGFYWTLESERAIRSLLLLFPPVRRERIRTLIEEFDARVGGYIRGQTLLCLAIGALALVAYLIIGLPYAIVLAIVAGVMEAVPIFGPALGAIPAILVALSMAPSKVIWIVLATVIIQGLENYLLVPRIMRRSVGVNPIVTLLALAAFASLLGLPGALLAIPLAAVIQLLLDHFVLDTENAEQPAPRGRSQASLLRYETQNLAQDVRKQLRQKDGQTDRTADQVEDNLEVIARDLDQLLSQIEAEERQR